VGPYYAYFRSLTTCVLLACFAGFAQPAAASTVLFRTDAELVVLSERVVHARVIAQRTAWGVPPGRRIYTVTTLSVVEDFTGRDGNVLEVWELGGAIGDEMLYVGGRVEYRVGEEVLVCLERGRQGLRSVAMGFSKFDVRRTTPGDAALTRNVRDTMIVGGAVPARERSLSEFRQLAAEVLGRSSRVVSGNELPSSVTQPFTKIVGEPGWRWREADFGVPVVVFKNTSTPPPLMSGDAVAEIHTALAAWTSPASASIILQYGGTAYESNVESGWSTIPARSTLITFEDPHDDIGGAVLALGGGSVSMGTGGTVGGTVYDGFDRGFVVFQNAVDLPASFRQPLNFTRVLTHEIGHTIGFGHTQTDGSVPNPTSSIMYASCCFDNSPVPPALGPDDLVGLNVVYPASPSTGPAMALDKTSLRFGAVTSGSSFVYRTSTQVVRLTQSGAGTVTWTATSSRPWLVVSPTSGTGPANLSVIVMPDATVPSSGVVDGAIILAFSGASNSPGPVSVRLTLALHGLSANPIGTVDTPVDNSVGVTGAVPFTGWALDDIETMRVNVCRAAVTGETPPANELCAGASQIYVGSAIFIDGARPDVQAAFPGYPLNHRGGWGFMVLTNMLPNQGNGTYQFAIYAQDREARFMLLGTRSISCNNADATRPFGTIDTPAQGGVVSGSNYVNFGWALTPPGTMLPGKIIPIDGSTITVFVDGVARGTVSYNHERPDIESAFPGYRNTAGANGAIGFQVIDTTTLSNGLHTISWVVTDNQNLTEGIGSRFFTVSNGSSPLTAATETAVAAQPSAETIAGASLDTTPIRGRRGWNLDGAWRSYTPNGLGRLVIRAEEVDRVELALGAHGGEHYTGYVRAGGTLAPLPTGSGLDAATGAFTWAPGAGFVGSYDLVFVRWAGETAVRRRELRIVLQPKSSGLTGPQIAIDVPRSQQDVGQPFVVAGWAADLEAETGTGVDTIHVWAYPLTGGAPVFLGTPIYGGARPDVSAVHGDRFGPSGFNLVVQGLAHGNYDLAVFPWSSVTGSFGPPRVVRVTIR